VQDESQARTHTKRSARQIAGRSNTNRGAKQIAGTQQHESQRNAHRSKIHVSA
jgi:hypothetical protein